MKSPKKLSSDSRAGPRRRGRGHICFELHPEDRALLSDTARATAARLKENHLPGFGIIPTCDPRENYYGQLWARDFALAACNYYAAHEPLAVLDSLTTILKYRKPGGQLPFRVEKEYMVLKLIPGLRILARPLFDLIEIRVKGRVERPVYRGRISQTLKIRFPRRLSPRENYFSIQGKAGILSNQILKS